MTTWKEIKTFVIFFGSLLLVLTVIFSVWQAYDDAFNEDYWYDQLYEAEDTLIDCEIIYQEKNVGRGASIMPEDYSYSECEDYEAQAKKYYKKINDEDYPDSSWNDGVEYP
jgi:hypothetical protein